ncbi:sel1 repeat family protein [Vibrio metschnikovii]|uniref:sel1 repeat family protein n=1 Tax=Vibrio metschnikovii TaxID=28172 RepID=UPI002FCB5ABC|nr:sel1 repeat family protein [Vibrio metschnikovii]
MWCKVKASLLILLFSMSSTAVFAQLERYELRGMSPEEAYETGRLLRAQYKNLESRPYLQYAADNDIPAAAFLYAMELSNYKTTIRTPLAARKYLLKSAELGNRRAMHQLYSDAEWLSDREIDYWRNKYYESLIQLGAINPSQATYELSRYYRDNDRTLSLYYLDLAVSFKHPRALMDKALLIEQGHGISLMPGARETTVRELYLAAAKTGYIPAIRHYIGLLESKDRFEEAYEWRLVALNQGDLISLASVANILLGQRVSYEFVTPNPIQAKAYIDLYLASAGKDRMQAVYEMFELDQQYIFSQVIFETDRETETLVGDYKNIPTFFHYDIFWDIN